MIVFLVLVASKMADDVCQQSANTHLAGPVLIDELVKLSRGASPESLQCLVDLIRRGHG